MSGFASGNDWDDELYTDRVDIRRPPPLGTKNQSGQYRPSLPVVLTDVPCKIQTLPVVEDIQATSAQVRQQIQVAFPFAVEISPDDVLEPKPPSVGNRIRVGSYDYDTTLEFGLVRGVEVT
jgi:hypothetical protein